MEKEIRERLKSEAQAAQNFIELIKSADSVYDMTLNIRAAKNSIDRILEILERGEK